MANSGIHLPVFSSFERQLPESALREFVPLTGVLAKPMGGDQVPAMGVIMCNTARPAAPCMDAVTADARVAMVQFEVVAEVTDYRVAEPDLADAVFPERAKDLNLRNLQIDTD